jgi:gliding motility-associated lipoprotein GldD
MISSHQTRNSQLATCILLFTLHSILFTSSCTSDNIPREKAYQRFYFPKKEYKKFTSPCGFNFDLAGDAMIENKDSFRNQKLTSDSCWFNIVYPDLNAKIHFSYKYYDNPDVLTKLLEDSYKLTSKHMSKATYIKDSVIDLPHLKGLIYSVGGNAASDKQFILTDYKHQFIRGAIYFSCTPNYDSLKPAIRYVDKDIYHMINTFKFQ